MPSDVVEKKLLVEVHYYDPYNFTLNETNKAITQWGKYADKCGKTETWANEAYADTQFQKMKTRFVDNGYGVIVGEYGAISRLKLGSDALNQTYAEFRRYYIQYITQSIVKHGLVPVYWDNGYIGDKSMGIFNRSTGAMAYPEIVKAIINTTNAMRAVKKNTSMESKKALKP
jgi:endoglucanase